MYAVVATTEGALEENGGEGEWGNRKPPENDKTRVPTGGTRERSEKSCWRMQGQTLKQGVG